MVGPHPQNQLTAAQMQAQQAAQAQASDRAKLRSRKPTDKNMPDGVEECIIGDGAQRYRDLREVERRLDATMTRKRLDLQDSVNRNVKVWWFRGTFKTVANSSTALQDFTGLG